MTTSNQSNFSPFASDTESVASKTEPSILNRDTDEYSIRTMQSDMDANKSNTNKSFLVEPKSSALVQTSNTTEPKPKPYEKEKITEDEVPNQKIGEPVKIVELTSPSANNEITNDNHNVIVKIIIAVIILLVICIIGLSTYYYIITKKNTPETIVSSSPVAETPIANPEPLAVTSTPSTIDSSEEKYSQSKPNYLTLDLNTLSADDVKNQLVIIANDLSVNNSTVPYEFIVVDSNNNPVAFPIFATAIKLNLAPELLSSLGTNFELYLYNDASKMRLGIAADINNRETLVKELEKQEKTFVADGSFLFLNNIPETANGSFSTGKYGDYSVRFINLDAEKNLSIDYTTTNSQLVIGTSKNTERAILDKLSQKDVLNKNDDSSKKNALGNCDVFDEKMSNCSPFVCTSPNPITGDPSKREIFGLVNGKCKYTMQLPNNGQMECNLTNDMQKKFADSSKSYSASGKASFSTTTSFSTSDSAKSETTSTVNGNPDPLEEALNIGQCVILGY